MMTITKKSRRAAEALSQVVPVRLSRHLTPEFFRYFAASVVALVVDTSMLLILARIVHYVVAAAAGFLIGSLVHYVLSVRFVFRTRKLQYRRWLETSVFLLVGLVALAVNVGVIALCVEWLSFQLFAAKLVAAGVSFVVAFVGRKMALFR
ncbi:MAG: GtrA family protein [Burkholderiaceae bacterium]|nr:GtrA family protein [Sulfuritalea sp.]MCF8176098.1 GtrA family protein [Burkholderiaceae bacterium]MCF8184891.1 GtrA family protein [Polynucleobacter sp.]